MKRFAKSFSNLARLYLVVVAIGMICSGVACNNDKTNKPGKNGGKSTKKANNESGSEIKNAPVK